MFKKKAQKKSTSKKTTTKHKLDEFIAPGAKFITMRKLASDRRDWVVEILSLDDDGNLVVEKMCEPGSRLHAQVQFKKHALGIINAR